MNAVVEGDGFVAPADQLVNGHAVKLARRPVENQGDVGVEVFDALDPCASGKKPATST